MKKWLTRQYADIKGNFKWALLVVLWAPLTAAVKSLLRLIPHFPVWAVWGILFLLSAEAFVWVAKSQRRVGQGAALSQTESSRVSLVTSTANFDAVTFFRLAYHSPLTEEAEANIRKAAADNQPSDKEGFYAKFIGVGLIAYIYDMIWSSIFKSQLLALLELNRKNGHLPLADIKSFYNQAAASRPEYYVRYTFDQWLSYMKSQLLLIVYPSNMVEITLRGKDFLKYLLHNGREPDQRTL
jgi:hypothetical protein